MGIAATRDKMYEYIKSTKPYQRIDRDENINKMHAEGMSVKQLALAYNLSKKTIYLIIGKGGINS